MPASTCWPSGPSGSARTGSRSRWSQIGQARAQSLGWPDAYPYTKALGERALVAQFGDTCRSPSSGPSIIESALAEPRPGWIRGFRMAEPIIISYARGLLREFPGVPEGVTDVIPVDLVVAAIIAVAGEALLRRLRRPGRRLRRPVGVPRGLGCPEPVPLRQARRAGDRLVPGAPPLRPGRAAHRGARVVVPRPGPGPAPADPGLQGDVAGRAGRRVAAHPGQAGRVDGRPRGAAPAGRPGPRLRRALRRLHRDGRAVPGRPAPGPVGPDGRGRPGHVLPRPGRHRLADLRPGDPPAVDHRARPGAHVARQVDQDQPRRPGPEEHPLPRPARGRLRPREHPHRLQRRRLLRLAGLTAPAARRAGRLRRRPPGRGAAAARPRPPRPGRLPPLLLPPL